MTERRFTVGGGKYTFILKPADYIVYVLRYGEPWLEIKTGSNAVHALVAQVVDMQAVVDAVRRWASIKVYANNHVERAHAAVALRETFRVCCTEHDGHEPSMPSVSEALAAFAREEKNALEERATAFGVLECERTPIPSPGWWSASALQTLITTVAAKGFRAGYRSAVDDGIDELRHLKPPATPTALPPLTMTTPSYNEDGTRNPAGPSLRQVFERIGPSAVRLVQTEVLPTKRPTKPEQSSMWRFDRPPREIRCLVTAITPAGIGRVYIAMYTVGGWLSDMGAPIPDVVAWAPMPPSCGSSKDCGPDAADDYRGPPEKSVWRYDTPPRGVPCIVTGTESGRWGIHLYIATLSPGYPNDYWFSNSSRIDVVAWMLAPELARVPKPPEPPVETKP